jgi:hypothetical protein
MKVLKDFCYVKTEMFASPINHFYDKFYSLFKIDENFGGIGNSLTQDFYPPGSYESNPPFHEVIFEKNALCIEKSI